MALHSPILWAKPNSARRATAFWAAANGSAPPAAAECLGRPVAIGILIVVALAAAYIARFTPLGRHIFAVGGNERAAALSGVRVTRVKMFVYMFSGFCAAIVGLVVSSAL